MSWLACLCNWIPSQEKQGILECTPSSGTYMPLPVVTAQPVAQCKPIQYLYALLAPPPSPPSSGTGHVLHDAVTDAAAPSLIEVAEARHMQRKEQQRQEREAREQAAAARTRITSAYGSRMLKVGPSNASRTPTPTSPAFPITAVLPDTCGDEHTHMPHTPVREVQHGYGTFSPGPVSIIGLGRPASPPVTAVAMSPPKRRTSRPPRAPRAPRGLTVRVPVMPLDSVRRHVTEMLFNVPSSPATAPCGAAALRPPYIAPKPRFSSLKLTAADRAMIQAAAVTDEMRNLLAPPDTPLTPGSPFTPTPTSHFASPFTPVTPFSPYSVANPSTPSLLIQTAPTAKEPPRTPPESLRGRPPKRQATSHRRTPSASTSVNTQSDDTGYVVYKHIGLSELPAPRRSRSKRQVRIAE